MSSVGGKYIGAYATSGQYDFVMVIEGPEDITKIFQAEAKIMSMGALSLETMPALPLEKFFKLL